MIKNILKGIRKNAMLIHTYIHTYIHTIVFSKWKEVQLFSNCTFDRKESEGLSLCSLFDRGVLC